MTAQLELGVLANERLPTADRVVVASYGGGVNSVAALVYMKRRGVRPRAIVMADPGSEWKHTITYRDETLAPWLHRVGFPAIDVITRIEEGEHNPRAWRLETLYDECWRMGTLPSVAYGWKKCSSKYKGDTQRWWMARQPWALEEWEAGRKIVRVIGYDASESSRVLDAKPNEWEVARFDAWYPLHDAAIDREGCEALILDEGLPLPLKSACTMCGNNTLAEWRLLRKVEPEAFEKAVALSRRAAESGRVENPDVVGLMRCNPHGMRQLHIWADGGYPELDESDEVENPMPCECSL